MPGFEYANFGQLWCRRTDDTPVRLFFTWDGAGAAPDEADVAMSLWIGVYEQTTPTNIFRGSSVHDKGPASWILEDKITVTKSGNDYTGECTIPAFTIPPVDCVLLVGRIYEPIEPIPAAAKTTAPADVPKTTTGTIIKTTAP